MDATPIQINTGQVVLAPPWLPGAVARMLPNFSCRTAREFGILQRLVSDPRMQRVWRDFAGGVPLKSKNIDTAMGTLFSLAYHAAVEDLPIVTHAQRRCHIEAVGGWAEYFISPVALRDGPLAVRKKADDPVARRLQLTLSAWMQREAGGPHISLVNTVAEVALGRKLSRWGARPPRGKPKPPRIAAVGC